MTIEWMPFELRPAPQATLRPEGEYLERVWRKSVYPMADQLGVEIILPRISPQPHTGLSFEGYQFALEQGKGQAYTHRMFTAFFQEEKNIGELSTLVRLAEEVGLEGSVFKQALESGTYRTQHLKALGHAKEFGVTAVPTLLHGPHRLQGLPSLPQLQSFLNIN